MCVYSFYEGVKSQLKKHIALQLVYRSPTVYRQLESCVLLALDLIPG